jgi:CheY-like chemotaxis protein
LEDAVTWLLVEDDNDIRNVVAVMMSVWGEKPLAFADGNAAWAWLDSVAEGKFTGELPDLALMDIRMPGHTGDKVAARIRQTPGVSEIPIILMTAFSLTDTEIREMMDQTGIDHLINKPLPDMEVFRQTLYRVRDERRAKNAAKKTAPAPAASAPAQPPAQPTPPAPSQAAPAAPTQPQAAPATPAAPTQSPASPAQPPTQSPVQQAAQPAPAQPSQPAQPAAPSAAPATPAAPAQPSPTPRDNDKK